MSRLRVIALLCVVLLPSACGPPAPPANETTRCESTEKELKECYQKTAEQLNFLARELDQVLSQQEERPEPPAEAEELPPVIVPATEEELIRAIVRKVDDATSGWKSRQESLERQVRVAAKEAREAQEALAKTMQTIAETTSSIDGEVSEETRNLRTEVAVLRLQREEDQRRLRGRATEIADLIRGFDAEKVNCPRCGRPNAFRRDLLTLHAELVKGLADLPAPVAPQ